MPDIDGPGPIHHHPPRFVAMASEERVLSKKIKAVTFDLWDTIVHDDSDEAKRKAQGLLSKYEARREEVWQALNRQAPTPREDVVKAYDVCDAAFNKVWREHFITWTISERLRVLLTGMKRELPPAEFDGVVERLGRMEVDIYPDLIADAREGLAELASRYKLAVVSDAIVTPGSNLRRLLEIHGVRQYFSGFAFSDEVGHSKPHRSMFDAAAKALGVEVTEMVHIGDRDHNDVKGPQALGMKAVLFTASRDSDKNKTSADAICPSYRDLPATVDRLNA